MHTLRLYNTLSGKIEDLSPLVPGQVRIYSCGVTTYDRSHLGHATQMMQMDSLVRLLKFLKYDVVFVKNYTDVDDKIIDRAASLGEDAMSFSARMVQESLEDERALGLIEPSVRPKVSEHIPHIIKMIEELIHNGAAYATSNGNVYFRVANKKDYGKLSRICIDQAQHSEGQASDKESQLDFALWKIETKSDARWASPWGEGRPGWHIECSAMSRAYLGISFDIHSGGRDLVFPHHENEIAQSESANNAEYAKIWFHSGLLTISGRKMSKSLGNHLTIHDYLKDWTPEVMRLEYLSHHYRGNIDFKEETFASNLLKLVYISSTLAHIESLCSDEEVKSAMMTAQDLTHLNENDHSFLDALKDDLNTPLALSKLWASLKRCNEIKSKKAAPDLADQLRSLYFMLGVTGIMSFERWQTSGARIGQLFLESLKKSYLKSQDIALEWVEAKILERNSARLQKDFQTSDRIRDELLSKGIKLMDQKDQKTLWSLSPIMGS